MRFKWYSMFLFTRVCLMKMITSNGADLKESCSVVQSLSCVQLFESPWTATCQVSLSFTISQSLLKLMSIEFIKPFNHLILSSTTPPVFNLLKHDGKCLHHLSNRKIYIFFLILVQWFLSRSGQKNIHTLIHTWISTTLVVVQLLSHVWLFATPWTAACQAL